jgi:hypothetical protein
MFVTDCHSQIADIPAMSPIWGEGLRVLEEKARAINPAERLEPLTSAFDKNRLILLLLMVDVIAKLLEVEFVISCGKTLPMPLKLVRPALENLTTTASETFYGGFSQLPDEVGDLASFSSAIKPLLSDLRAMACRLVKLTDPDPPVKFQVSEDALDSLRYIPKSTPPLEPLTSLFEPYLAGFEASNSDTFVAAFVPFYQKAITYPILAVPLFRLKTTLAELLIRADANSPVFSLAEEVAELNRTIQRRISLLETGEIELILSILSWNLIGFDPVSLAEPASFMAATVGHLAVLFLDGKEQSLDNVRELALLFETIMDFAPPNCDVFDDEMTQKFKEVISNVCKLVPSDVMGSLGARVRLKLFVQASSTT